VVVQVFKVELKLEQTDSVTVKTQHKLEQELKLKQAARERT
jgi:hypothetical protein